MTARNRVRIICTDHGEHPSRDLALIDWTAELVDGFAIWDETQDRSTLTPSSMGETVRRSHDGANHVTHRTPVEIRRRADGGQTFLVPSCPTCEGQARPLRDDTLNKILDAFDDTPGSDLDVSLIP